MTRMHSNTCVEDGELDEIGEGLEAQRYRLCLGLKTDNRIKNILTNIHRLSHKTGRVTTDCNLEATIARGTACSSLARIQWAHGYNSCHTHLQPHYSPQLYTNTSISYRRSLYCVIVFWNPPLLGVRHAALWPWFSGHTATTAATHTSSHTTLHSYTPTQVSVAKEVCIERLGSK